MSFGFPATIDQEKVFLVQSSQLESRWDPNFYRCMKVFRGLINQGVFPFEKLRKSLSLVQYGISERATTEQLGVPMLRMINLQDDAWDLSELKFIEMSNEAKAHYLLKSGDILFNRTNSKELVGKCGVFDLEDDYVFASYLIRVRLKPSTFLPDFLSAFLSSSLGRIQIDGISRQIAGMTNINAEEIRELLIPAAPFTEQKKVVQAWKAALATRDKALVDAKNLLATIDDILIDELGIAPEIDAPATLKERMFQRRFSEMTGQRFDPHFHRPQFEALSNELRSVPHATIRELVYFSSEQWNQKDYFRHAFPYIEIGSVDLAFGSLEELPLIPISEAASRAKMLVRPGDLLISLTRPTRKAICFAPVELEIAIASNGFCVVRGFKNADLNSRYLFHVLRSRLCTDQFDQRSSGGNYPAITEEQLSKLVIPLAKPEKQSRIVKLLDAQYTKAEKLFADARADLEQAKRDIEALILGKES